MRSFLFLFVMCVSFSALAQESVSVNVRGVVVNEAGLPLEDAVVFLSGTAVRDTTDTSGRFIFRDVQPGTWTLIVKMPDSIYMSSKKSVDVQMGESDAVVVMLRQRVYTGDEVVVIGTSPSVAEKMEDSPSQVDVVTRAEFEGKSATVEDVIASTPSAIITSYGGLGSFSEVSLRGAYSNQVQVYVDGMLLNEAVGGAVNLGLIPLTNVDRIETWRSGAPARFGGDSVGGAINIVTRDYHENRGSVSLGGGSFGTWTGHVLQGFGPPESRLIVSLDGAASRNDFDYSSDNGTPQNDGDDYTTHRRNNEFRTLNGLIKYRRVMGEALSFELSEHMLHSRKNLPSTQHILHSGASMRTTKNLFQARMTISPKSMHWLEVSPVLHNIVSREHYRDRGGHVGWGNQDNIYDTVTFRGMVPVTVRRGDIGEISITPVASRESYSPEHRLEKTVPLSSDREHLGLVGDAMLMLPDARTTMTANIRRDRYFSDYEGRANIFTPYPPPSRFDHFTNMQTGVRFDVHPLMSLRWNYGDNWRVPSFYELFGDRGGIVSKAGLKPEHVYRWDAGIRMKMPERMDICAGRLDVVYFRNNYRNLIQWYTNNYGFIEPANVTGSYVRGTELVWNFRVAGPFGVRGNWTFQESEVTNTVKSYHQGKLLPNRPDHYGVCTMEYTRGKAVLFWNIDHKDEYYLDRSNQPHKQYDGRTLHDAGVSVKLANNKIMWRVMVKNLSDKRSFDIQGMPKPGRSILVTVNYSPG